MKREAFYAALRTRGSGAFGTSLKQGQVDGCEAILAACEGLPVTHAAYTLATCYHETAHTMQPVRETLAPTDDQAIARLDKAFAAGKLKWVKSPYWRKDADGKTWLGRGYVQLTHKANYARAGRELALDLVGNPSLAMQPTVAALILVRGSAEGWFTGKKLSDYLPGDYVGARRIINGTDRAQDIAGYARAFEAALLAAEWGQSAKNALSSTRPAAPVNKTPKTEHVSPWAAIINAIIAIFGKGRK